MLRFVDTHTHLYLPDFDIDRDACLKNALDAGVDRMILPNIDSHSVEALNQLTEASPQNFFPLMGLHPTYVKEDYLNELNCIFTHLESGKYKGVGEIGLDLYWDQKYLKEQTDAFLKQINYAIEKKLPAIIHVRDAFDETFKALESLKAKKIEGIFHAFTGNLEQAQKAIEMGFLIGIGGIISFKNTHLKEVVRNLDLNHLVLETDSPYLAPVPYRGKRNQSSYLPLVAECIAELKGLRVEEVALVTTKNAERIFQL